MREAGTHVWMPHHRMLQGAHIVRFSPYFPGPWASKNRSPQNREICPSDTYPNAIG